MYIYITKALNKFRAFKKNALFVNYFKVSTTFNVSALIAKESVTT